MFGKRLLKKWVLSPLVCPEAINERLNAVEDLRKIPFQLEKFREKMANLNDLEKMLSKAFVYSVKTNFRTV